MAYGELAHELTAQAGHVVLGGEQPRDIQWRLAGAELEFFENGEPRTLEALELTPKQQLNLISRALYHKADNGYDPDPSATKVAAAHVVYDKHSGQRRVFVAANANHRARSQRFDAEAVALAQAKHMLGVGNFMVEATYLTLHNKGTRMSTPCGTCREELTNPDYIAQDAKLLCVPYFSPEEAEQPDFELSIDDQTQSPEPDIAHTPPRHAFMMNMMDLHPLYEIHMPETTPDGKTSWCDKLRAGVEHATDLQPAMLPLELDDDMKVRIIDTIGVGEDNRVAMLENDGYTLENVNAYLSTKLKAAYNKHVHSEADKDKFHKARAVLVVRENGEVYSSVYVDAKGLGAKPPGEIAGLSNAFNARDIKEVFVMELDPKNIERICNDCEEKDAQAEQGHKGPKVRTFYAEALDRIFKSSYRAENVYEDATRMDIRQQYKAPEDRKPMHTRCMMHVLPLNDGTLSREELLHGTQSLRIEDVYPNAYKSPNSAAQGAQTGVGR